MRCSDAYTPSVSVAALSACGTTSSPRQVRRGSLHSAPRRTSSRDGCRTSPRSCRIRSRKKDCGRRLAQAMRSMTGKLFLTVQRTAVRAGFGMFDILPLPYQFELLISLVAPYLKVGGVVHSNLNQRPLSSALVKPKGPFCVWRPGGSRLYFNRSGAAASTDGRRYPLPEAP